MFKWICCEGLEFMSDATTKEEAKNAIQDFLRDFSISEDIRLEDITEEEEK